MRKTSENRRERRYGHAVGQAPMSVEDRAELNTRLVILPDVPPSTEYLPHRANAMKLTTLKKVCERYNLPPNRVGRWLKVYEGAPEIKGRLVNGSGTSPYLYSAEELVAFVEKILNTQFMHEMLKKPKR